MLTDFNTFLVGFLDELCVLHLLGVVPALFHITSLCIPCFRSLGMCDSGLQSDVPTEVGCTLRLCFKLHTGELCWSRTRQEGSRQWQGLNSHLSSICLPLSEELSEEPSKHNVVVSGKSQLVQSRPSQGDS